MQCWASKYCKKYPNKCSEFCHGRVLLEVYYSQSNIPIRYQFEPDTLKVDPVDMETMKEVKNIMTGNISEWVEQGNNLLLWGENKGNGKTTIACMIAGTYIREQAKEPRDLAPVAYFIKTAKFLEDIRKQYDNPTEDFPYKLKLIEKVPLLIIDDIGAEKASDWVRERLLTIIDERYSNNRSTIYTSNCSMRILNENLHERIVDRIRDSKILHFQGVSKRGVNFNG